MLRPAFAALSAVVLVTACSGPASVKQARQSVDVFHSHFNNGEDQAIWDSTSDGLKGNTTQAELLGALGSVRGEYGRVVSTEQQGWHIKNSEGKSLSRVDMKTKFEKGNAYEQFVFRNMGGGKQLLEGWSLSDEPPPPDSEN